MFTGILLFVLGLAVIIMTCILAVKSIRLAASDTSSERNTARMVRTNVYPALLVALLGGMLSVAVGVAKLISLATMNG